VAAALALLAREVGASLLCGVLAVASMLAANKQLAAATFRQQQALLLAGDERARLVRELLGGIKVIKLQAGELRFEERIQHARAAEVRAMMHLHTYAAHAHAAYTSAHASARWPS
jgi:ABC-type bacteriocin/lantibiotic exporter with double-glycine peptidase domain